MDRAKAMDGVLGVENWANWGNIIVEAVVGALAHGVGLGRCAGFGCRLDMDNARGHFRRAPWLINFSGQWCILIFRM